MRTTSSCSRHSVPTRPWASSSPTGPGLHHVAYQVDDIDSTLATLDEAGLRLIDRQPRTGIGDSRVAFVHPKAAGGVLIEIVQPAEAH